MSQNGTYTVTVNVKNIGKMCRQGSCPTVCFCSEQQGNEQAGERAEGFREDKRTETG